MGLSIDNKRTLVHIHAVGRSKIISDEILLERLVTALIAHGPSDLSFSKASRAAGLAAATLVQRFGSRDGMVEAILLHAWDQLDIATTAADKAASDDPAGAIELLMALTSPGTVEANFADGLLLLREDIRNPVLRARGAAWGEHLADRVGNRLSGDREHASRLGWQMVSLWQGAIIWSSFRQDGDGSERVRAVLEDWCRAVGALKPYAQHHGLPRPEAAEA